MSPSVCVSLIESPGFKKSKLWRMPGRLRIAARSDLLSAMRRKMPSSVSFLPTTTSMMEATLACWAMIGGGAGSAAVAAGTSAAGWVAAAIGSGEWPWRQATKAAAASAPPNTRHVAKTLIREEFFQNPRMLRGTINS
jgi:hypothetical protein